MLISNTTRCIMVAYCIGKGMQEQARATHVYAPGLTKD